MTFKNEKQLKEFLLKKCINAVDNTEKKVHAEFAGNLNQFYTEFKPAEYIRTGALYGSLDKTGVQTNGDSVTATVFFDEPHYEKGQIPLQSGRMGYAEWDDQKIFDYALHRGSHGGYVEGTSIWNESINSLGSIKGLLMSEIKKQGL